MRMNAYVHIMRCCNVQNACMHYCSQSKMFCGHAAIVKPKAGPSGKVYTEEDWNTEVDENAQGADAYRYSKVLHTCNLLYAHLILNTILQPTT